jgi:putative flavoprotein involved in K+ transport
VRNQDVDVVVVGGGQAGLAMSYYLTQQGRQHIVLEQKRIAESWRSKRWNSLVLVAPNWTLQFPGFSYKGDDPDGFMSKDEVAAFFEQYAQSFNSAVQTGIRVISLEQNSDSDGYSVQTNDTIYEAANVVIATGQYQLPKIPSCSVNLPSAMVQIAAYDYRCPDVLPPGGIVVVGSGESGCQIAEELRHSGRNVYLSTGTTGWAPRRYRGKDTVWWLVKVGMFDQTVDILPPGPPKFVGPQSTGKAGGHDLNLHTLARDGVVLLGRLRDISDGKFWFASDLRDNIARSDEFAIDACKAIDEYIQTNGIDAPAENIPQYTQAYGELGVEPILELDIQTAGIAAIIWATGYRPDFGWVHVPIFDEVGYPIHKRGVTRYPGLYLLGFDWLYKFKSGLLLGVGEDAEYIASCIASRNSSGR